MVQKNKAYGTPGDEVELEGFDSSLKSDTAQRIIQQWIEEATGQPFRSSRFVESLQDGVLLCYLVKRIQPDSEIIQDVIENPSPLESQINLKKFLGVCSDLGLSGWQLFDPKDLDTGDNVMWKSHLTDVIILVGGVIENGVQACCHCYNPLTNKWYYLSPVIDSRVNFGLAGLHSELFVVGGSTLGENMTVLSSVERLDPKFNTWEKVTSLSTGCFNHEAVELDGNIYVVGGVLGNNSKEQTMQCYDHVTDSWTSLSPPRQTRYTHCAVTLDSYIYVIGGISKHNTILKTVERHDPQQNKWTNVASLNTPRTGACAVVLMGQIFVMGGRSDSRKILSSCEIYNPATDKWSCGKEMNTKRDRAGAAEFGGKIYVFGGSYGHVAVTSVECYDWRENEWSIITELPYPRYGFRCAKAVVTRDMMAEVPPAKPKAPRQEKLI